jgi:phosphoglycerate dehydrogenase-like enzyme
MGSIGTEVARLARAFRMRTLGIKRTTTDVAADWLNLDQLHPPEALRVVLPHADYVVLVAPHTPETDGIIGEHEIALMRRNAVLINIGRGALADEAALVRALSDGAIAGAALDVFQREPLPPESPLWSLPNVLTSPHSGATSDRENARITDLFIDNLQRYLDGKPLRNVFDAERGY